MECWKWSNVFKLQAFFALKIQGFIQLQWRLYVLRKTSKQKNSCYSDVYNSHCIWRNNLPLLIYSPLRLVNDFSSEKIEILKQYVQALTKARTNCSCFCNRNRQLDIWCLLDWCPVTSAIHLKVRNREAWQSINWLIFNNTPTWSTDKVSS